MKLKQFIDEALREDIGNGDHSSLACIPSEAINKAKLLIKDSGVLAGMEIPELVYGRDDINISWQALKNDGDKVFPGDIAFTIEGSTRDILKTERLVLNLMQRMSGIASFTNRMTSLLEGTTCKLLDTRKTTPLLRELEKKAVLIGGGMNHRFGLYDMIMLKDNHIDYAGGIDQAIKATLSYLSDQQLHLDIIVEARNLDEVKQILPHEGVKRILLDNFEPYKLKEAVQLIAGKFETEASGGIHAGNLREYAYTGVDYISMGALTHTVKNFDLSLKAYV
jgi:nicotinate-nucleotide pyrophosphorylase (carboxylating)